MIHSKGRTMKSKEHEQHQSNETHHRKSNHTEKEVHERPLNFLWSSIKMMLITYFICTVIVSVVLVYCGFAMYHAPLLTFVLLLGLSVIGYL